MRTIYKYQVDNTNDWNGTISLPENTQVLSAGVQNGNIFIWCLVDTDNALVERRFEVIGTGWDMSEFVNNNLVFIDTVFVDWMVFHVFEVI